VKAEKSDGSDLTDQGTINSVNLEKMKYCGLTSAKHRVP